MTQKDLYKHILGPDRRYIVFYLAGSGIQGVCLPLTMLFTQKMIDSIAGETSMAYRFILLLFVTFIVNIFTKRYLEYIGVCVKNSIHLHGGELIFKKMSAIKYDYLEEKDAYQLVDRINERYDNIYMESVRSWGIMVRLVISFLGIFYYLTLISPWILVIMLATIVPVQALSVYSVTREFNSWETVFPFLMKARYLSGLLTKRNNIKEARIFQYDKYIERNWEKLSDRFNKGQISSNIRQRYGVAACIFLQYAVTVFVLFCIYPQIETEAVTLGIFIAAAQAMWNFTGGFQYELIQMFRGMKEGRMFTEDLRRFLSYETVPMAQVSEDAVTFQSLELKDIWYRYDKEGAYILQGVSLAVSRGDKVGLVGENGSGKSTLSKMISGLIKPVDGGISYDGICGDEITFSSLYRNSSVVLQDFTKYKMTIRENIQLGDTERKATDEELLGLLSEMEITFISDLDSPLGIEYGGGDLSGGEWQQLAIARAGYKQAAVMILDEPTSALDPLKEAQLFYTFARMCRDKIGVIITHRLSLCSFADHIAVMNEGRLAEYGTHEQLMEQNGQYAGMYRKQADLYGVVS